MSIVHAYITHNESLVMLRLRELVVAHFALVLEERVYFPALLAHFPVLARVRIPIDDSLPQTFLLSVLLLLNRLLWLLLWWVRHLERFFIYHCSLNQG